MIQLAILIAVSGIIKARTKAGRASVHEEYQKKLGKMTHDFEMMAAGKLLASGSKIHFGDLRNAGRAQLKLERKATTGSEPTRTGKKKRRMKGTTKRDDSDDEDTAFALRAMGMERATDKEISAAAEARKLRKREGDDGAAAAASAGAGVATARAAGVSEYRPKGASSFEAAKLAQMVADERGWHGGAGAGTASSPSSSGGGAGAKQRWSQGMTEAAAAASASSDAFAEPGEGLTFADATTTGGSAFSLGGGF